MKSSNPFSTSSFRVKPINTPEVIRAHVERINGKWVEKPGTRVAIIGVTAKENIDEDIENSFAEIWKNSTLASSSELQTKIHDCQHKLYAVRFHLQAIKNEIDKQHNDFQKNYKAGSGVSFEQKNPILIYETESFLFQVKSNLDLIVQALGYVVPSLKSFRTFKHSGSYGQSDYIAGGKVIKELEKTLERELQNIFDDNRKTWIQEMAIWRDTIAHHSQLKKFTCFIEEPFRGGNVIIHYPSMPNGEKLDDYCNKTYKNLIGLYKEVLKIIETKLC